MKKSRIFELTKDEAIGNKKVSLIKKIFCPKVSVPIVDGSPISYPEVTKVKIYRTDVKFYILGLLSPAAGITIITTCFWLWNIINDTFYMAVVGIIGSYIASVVVAWIIAAKECKDRTLYRLRYQGAYLADLEHVCTLIIETFLTFLVRESKEKIPTWDDFKKNPKITLPTWQKLYSKLLGSGFGDFGFVLISISNDSLPDDTINNPTIIKNTKKYANELITKQNAEDILLITRQYLSSLNNAIMLDCITQSENDIITKLCVDLQRIVSLAKEEQWPLLYARIKQFFSDMYILYPMFYSFRGFRESNNTCICNQSDSNLQVSLYISKLVHKRDEYVKLRVPLKEYLVLRKLDRMSLELEKEALDSEFEEHTQFYTRSYLSAKQPGRRV